METSVTPGWRFIGIGIEGTAVSLRGINPWQHKWKSCGTDKITVAHPSYPLETHTMFVFELDAHGSKVRFAAGEFSNGVWGFYLPE